MARSSKSRILPIVFAALAVVLAAPTNAAGWRSLRIDASNEAAFVKSVALFRSKLSASREHAFNRSLQDIWIAGTEIADAEQRDYTPGDYFQQLDGLSYDEVVEFIDPTGRG